MMNKSFMCRTSLFSSLALIASLLTGQPAAADSVLSITADSVRTMTIQGAAKDVIVANPAVIDIALQRPDHFTIIGKAIGRTTLLILDADQKVLLSTTVVVSEGDPGMLTVRGPRGGAMSQDSYACAQRCSLIPGSSIGGSSGQGSMVANPDPEALAAAKQPQQVTKVDTKYKMKVSPNGDITGTRTSTPQYGQ